MKLSGHPSRVGEIKHQAGAVATAVKTDQGLQWDVHRLTDGHTRRTERLAHVSHWTAVPYEPSQDFTAAFKTLEQTPAPSGTLLYPDCSNNNWASTTDAVNFVNQLAAQGFAGMCHKVSEGNYYEDPYWPVVLQTCQKIEFPCLGFHYVTTDDPASQIQTWWAAGGGGNCMFDFEANSGTFANYQAVAAAFTTAGVTPNVGYIPQWYWESVGGGDLSGVPHLVSSAYPDGAGDASTVYANSGADTGDGWVSYGNATPTCWQFTDSASIAGVSPVDCNAFKGTPDELATIFDGGTVTLSDDVQDVQTQLRGPDLAGWPQLAGHTVVDALAVIGEKLGIPGFSPPTAS
jgi:hypothetical protein